MTSRRRFLARSATALTGLTAAHGFMTASGPNPAQDGSGAKGMITPAAQKAIDQGLAYLADRQRTDGSFGEHRFQGNVAVTSLAGLAFLAAGHQPGRGPRGRVVLDCLRYVLLQEETAGNGFLHRALATNHGPMYSHGFGTLFLGEAHGLVHEPRLRDDLRAKLKRATELIIRSQNSEGGWRYEPRPYEADISVTVCQIMALRSARTAGIDVPKSTVENCIRYVKQCQAGDGGFRYMQQGGPPAFARTAAGLAALYSAGVYTGPVVEKGLDFLMRYLPNRPLASLDIPDLHYFYGHYYAAQVMWIAGGQHWQEWYPAIRDELITRVNRYRGDGAWSDSICSHYATAMACIILQVPNNYLPILQK